MKEYVVGKVEDIPEGAGIAVQIGHRTLALFKIDGEVYGIHNKCTHKGASLCEGTVDKERKVIRCPWHLWDWSLETGELEAYHKKRMPLVHVRVVDGEVVVRA